MKNLVIVSMNCETRTFPLEIIKGICHRKAESVIKKNVIREHGWKSSDLFVELTFTDDTAEYFRASDWAMYFN